MSENNWLNHFVDTYQKLSPTNLDSLKTIYHPEVNFQDPLHKLSGFSQLLDYFNALYTQVTYCQFIVTSHIQSDDEAAIYWTMTYQHKQLNHGRKITVEGHSKLRMAQGLVIYHRDYLDVGSMLYEHIPLVGRIIKIIKSRAAST